MREGEEGAQDGDSKRGPLWMGLEREETKKGGESAKRDFSREQAPWRGIIGQGGKSWMGGPLTQGGRAPSPLHGREEGAVGLRAGQGGSTILTAPLFTTNCDIRYAAKSGGLRGWKRVMKGHSQTVLGHFSRMLRVPPAVP